MPAFAAVLQDKKAGKLRKKNRKKGRKRRGAIEGFQHPFGDMGTLVALARFLRQAVEAARWKTMSVEILPRGLIKRCTGSLCLHYGGYGEREGTPKNSTRGRFCLYVGGINSFKRKQKNKTKKRLRGSATHTRMLALSISHFHTRVLAGTVVG